MEILRKSPSELIALNLVKTYCLYVLCCLSVKSGIRHIKIQA